MKKVVVSGVVILAFIVFALHEQGEGAEAVKKVTPPQSISTGGSSAGSETTNPNTSGNNTTPAPTPAPTARAGTYKDGTYTGPATDAFYGLVQVKATIANGKISDVQFLQYPNDRRTSVEINTQAMPYLKQEAIAAQSANVDIVSGATQTSEAFKQSLAGALSQAK